MRICLLARADYPIVERRARRFAQRGHEVHIVSLQDGAIEGCTVHRVGSTSTGVGAYLRATAAVVRAVRRIQPDVIDAHSAVSYGAFTLLPLGAPTVVTVYGPELYGHYVSGSVVFTAMVRRVLRSARLVIASTDAVRAYVRGLGVDESEVRLRIRQGGIPLDDVLGDAHARRQRVREAYGVAPDSRVVLHSRHIAPIWRVGTVVDAFLSLDAPGAELWLAYPPPSPEGQALYAQIRQTVRDAGAAGRVRFLGRMPYDELISVMHAADVYVCVGRDDLLAASVQEAAATGLVPILTDLPPYRVLFDDANAVLLDSVDVPILREALSDVLETFEARQPAFAAESLARLRRDFDISAGVTWLLAQYEEARRPV